MFKPWTTPTSLDDALRGLDRSITVFVLDDAWLAVAPSGLMVLTEDAGDLDAATLRAAERADEVRLRLAAELVWVPVVEGVCVSAEAVDDTELPCLVVTPEQLAPTLETGAATWDDDTMSAVRRLGHPTLP
ncbi:MAG: hypothetical protein U0Q22_16375 [Acidimicrobiales bacterium]